MPETKQAMSMKRRGWTGTLMISALLSVGLGVAVPGFAKEKEFLRELRKALEEKVRVKVQEVVGDQLVRYDKTGKTLSFAPIVLKQAGILAQKRMDNVKKLSLDPHDDRIGFAVETVSGMKIGFDMIPEALEIDAREMAIVTKMPQGIDLKQSEAAEGSIMSFFDSLLGISQKISLLTKNVLVTGESMRFHRPVFSSALARVLKSGEGDDKSMKMVFPLSVKDGWLQIGLQDSIPQKRLLDVTLEILLEKLKEEL